MVMKHSKYEDVFDRMGREKDERVIIEHHLGKRIRRLPIVVPALQAVAIDGGEKLPKMARWKRYWLSHWYSDAYRGRVTSADYGRLHGVSRQAVAWLIERGRLGEVTRDRSAGYWVLADWPYPETARIGGYGRRGEADATVRALGFTDFVQAGGARCPSAAYLESYCQLMGIYARPTLDDVLAGRPWHFNSQ